MTIYEALGIENILLNIDIPQKIILDNLQSSQHLQKAQNYFKVIDKVILRASLQRSNCELQVIEISLTKPKFIQEISLLIQTAIKYHIVFIFTYNDMALIMQRNFQMTNSTDHIYSYGVSLSTEWIYFENLSNEVYFGFEPFKNISDDDDLYLNENETVNGIDNTSFQNIFSDIFKSITALNAFITENTLIFDALQINPKAGEILMAHGMHCLGCALAHMETIEQAVGVHGVDLEKLLEELNDLAE